MKKYLSPEAEIISFTATDVILASGTPENGHDTVDDFKLDIFTE